jgi:hypothetical protein
MSEERLPLGVPGILNGSATLLAKGITVIASERGCGLTTLLWQIHDFYGKDPSFTPYFFPRRDQWRAPPNLNGAIGMSVPRVVPYNPQESLDSILYQALRGRRNEHVFALFDCAPEWFLNSSRLVSIGSIDLTVVLGFSGVGRGFCAKSFETLNLYQDLGEYCLITPASHVYTLKLQSEDDPRRGFYASYQGGGSYVPTSAAEAKELPSIYRSLGED